MKRRRLRGADREGAPVRDRRQRARCAYSAMASESGDGGAFGGADAAFRDAIRASRDSGVELAADSAWDGVEDGAWETAPGAAPVVAPAPPPGGVSTEEEQRRYLARLGGAARGPRRGGRAADAGEQSAGCTA